MSKKLIDYSLLEANREFYLKNKDYLVKLYNGKFLLLYGLEVVNFGSNGVTLSQEGITKYGVGNFCVQFCAQEEPRIDLSHIVRVLYGA